MVVVEIMALQNSAILCHKKSASTLLQTPLLPPISPLKPSKSHLPYKNFLAKNQTISAAIKIVRSRPLDLLVTKSNKLRFVQKLKTLLLSKPHHYLPLHILSKCRSYLSLSPSHSLSRMIHRYPSIFELFHSSTALCVRLTPAASAVAAQETALKTKITTNLAQKLQKLLMMSLHKRLLLSKLVHLAPDLGLPPNFRSRLCNDHPDRFRTVETSYGRALELVSWDPELAVPFARKPDVPDLIMDRPLKFKRLKLRKGVNLKRKHRDFLIKFSEMPEISPYADFSGMEPFTIEAEKRACGVVQEILNLMVEKRTLVDHLTHFRKDFGLSNKLRGMLIRHPDLFYVSIKGQRDSVFLVDGYDEKGQLLEKDGLLLAKEKLMELVREGKRMRRQRRNSGDNVDNDDDNDDDDYSLEDDDTHDDDDDDGLEDLFKSELGEDWEDFVEEEDGEIVNGQIGEFWTVKTSTNGEGGVMDPW